MSPSTKPPVVFVSYSPFDLRHDRDHLLSLLQKLERELPAVSAREVELFYERGISPGNDWERLIEEKLDHAQAFLAILTPQFLNSTYCVRETRRFLKREESLERSDLLLPIHYLGDLAHLGSTSLGEQLWNRQMSDWRELRFEHPDSKLVLSRVHEVAQVIASRLGV
jgi:hypothetical protein